MLSPGCLGPRTQTQGCCLSQASPLNHKNKDSIHHTTLILRLVVDMQDFKVRRSSPQRNPPELLESLSVGEGSGV